MNITFKDRQILMSTKIDVNITFQLRVKIFHFHFVTRLVPGRKAQLITCLTADPGVASLIPARSHTFVEIDHEIISTAILLPSAVSRRVVSYKRSMCIKYRLTSLPRKKVWLGELTALT